MSIFSKFRNAKKAAEKAKKAQAAKDHEVEQPVPYKHVPTHAAIDALSGAPSSWQLEDRDAIRVQNEKRRSQMIRNYSGLSTATSVNTAMNRNSSFNSSDTYGTRDSASASASRPEMRRSHLGYQGYDPYHAEQQQQQPHPASYRHSRQMQMQVQVGKSPLASTRASSSDDFDFDFGIKA